ncbi:hypothetical protein Tco_0212802 [Tanacetum coccineum]
MPSSEGSSSSSLEYYFQQSIEDLPLPPPPPLSRIPRTQTQREPGESSFESEVVPSSLLTEVAPILRVANEVQQSNPRVAYLCKKHLRLEQLVMSQTLVEMLPNKQMLTACRS